MRRELAYIDAMPSLKSALYLTTEFPFPPTSGGRVRSFAQLSLLSDMMEQIDVMSVYEENEPATLRDAAALRQRLPNVRTVAPVFHPIHLRQHPRAVPRVLAKRALGLPYLAAKWDSPKIKRSLVQWAKSNKPDLVYIDHVGMAIYLPLLRALFPDAPVVLEEHNVESDFFAGFVKDAPTWFKPVAQLEAYTARAFETKMLRDVDSVVAISDEDARSFARMANITSTVVPQRVEPSDARGYAPIDGEVMYVGNLGWHANVRGLDWFFAEVWQKAMALQPNLRLSLIGSGAKKRSDGRLDLPDAWFTQGVHVLGFVENLDPHYERAAALIAPVVGDMGVRMKLLGAMAAGVPVVTTRDGAAGLPLQDKLQLDVTDDPDEFARRLVAVAMNAELGAQRREAAFEFLRVHHSNHAAIAAMTQVFERARVVHAARRGTPSSIVRGV